MTVRANRWPHRVRAAALAVLAAIALLASSCVGWHIPNPPLRARDGGVHLNGFLGAASDTCVPGSDASAASDASRTSSCDNARTGIVGESDCGAPVDVAPVDAAVDAAAFAPDAPGVADAAACDAQPTDAGPTETGPTDTGAAGSDAVGDPDAGDPGVPLVP